MFGPRSGGRPIDSISESLGSANVVRWIQRLAAAAGALLILRTIVRLALVTVDDSSTLATEYSQWDMSAYYYGPLAFRLGGDPYDRAELTALAGVSSAAYVYPPLTLFAFWPLTALPFSVAYYAWLALKVAALVGLMWVWVRSFVGATKLPIFVFIAGFAFNSALIRDLNAGNISMLEQLGLWTAISVLGRGHPGAFAALIVTVAQFKLTPVLFLLLLVWRERPRWTLLACSAGAAAALFAANLLVSPRLTLEFFRTAGAHDERGVLNPSSLALIRDVLEWAGAAGWSSAPGLDLVVFLAIVVLVWSLTLRAFLRLDPARSQERHRLGATSLFCFAFALTMPRFKDYSYMLLLIPTWWFLAHSTIRWVALAAWGAVLVSSNYASDALGVGSGYAPLATAAVLWALLLVEISEDRRATPVSARSVHDRWVGRARTESGAG